jgi:hypothetical protein
LVLFRLEELGVGYVRKLVASQDVNKMFKFLTFFFNEENIKTWMADEVKLRKCEFVNSLNINTNTF